MPEPQAKQAWLVTAITTAARGSHWYTDIFAPRCQPALLYRHKGRHQPRQRGLGVRVEEERAGARKGQRELCSLLGARPWELGKQGSAFPPGHLRRCVAPRASPRGKRTDLINLPLSGAAASAACHLPSAFSTGFRELSEKRELLEHGSLCREDGQASAEEEGERRGENAPLGARQSWLAGPREQLMEEGDVASRQRSEIMCVLCREAVGTWQSQVHAPHHDGSRDPGSRG